MVVQFGTMKPFKSKVLSITGTRKASKGVKFSAGLEQDRFEFVNPESLHCFCTQATGLSSIATSIRCVVTCEDMIYPVQSFRPNGPV
jgi:hypothetical protein